MGQGWSAEKKKFALLLFRREVHEYLISVGYEYLATLKIDDLFVKKELNTPERSDFTVKTLQQFERVVSFSCKSYLWVYNLCHI